MAAVLSEYQQENVPGPRKSRRAAPHSLLCQLEALLALLQLNVSSPMGWVRELSLLELPQAVGICAKSEKRGFGFRVCVGPLACVPKPLRARPH